MIFLNVAQMYEAYYTCRFCYTFSCPSKLLETKFKPFISYQWFTFAYSFKFVFKGFYFEFENVKEVRMLIFIMCHTCISKYYFLTYHRIYNILICKQPERFCLLPYYVVFVDIVGIPETMWCGNLGPYGRGLNLWPEHKLIQSDSIIWKYFWNYERIPESLNKSKFYMFLASESCYLVRNTIFSKNCP